MYINATGTELKLSSAVNNWTIGGAVGGLRTGTAKNDVFFGVAGETLSGGAGDDTYSLYDASAKVVEKAGEGIDTINVYYWGGIVLPDNVENVFLMSKGANWATGNALNNLIVAGSVGATLDGGAGNDVLVGGAGADIFVIKAGNGSDTIEKFQPGWDVVKLSGYGFTSFSQLKAVSTQIGNDVSIKLSSTETLILRGTQLSSLGASDFNLPLTTKVSSLLSGVTDTISAGAGKAWNFNGWYVYNNNWGSSGLTAGKDYTLTNSFNTKDVTAGLTFNWSYPVSTSLAPKILAFPEVIFGSSPLNTTPVATKNAVFPVKLGDLSGLSAKYDVGFGGTVSGFNVAYDIWLSKSPTATGDAAVSNEVMIWVHKGDFAAHGDAMGSFQLNGTTFQIFHTGTYTALVADKDVPAGTLDLKAVFAKLTQLGITSGTEYLRSIELGAEVVSGSGWLTVNDLDLTVATKAADGSTKTTLVTGAGSTVTTTAAASLTASSAVVAKELAVSAVQAPAIKPSVTKMLDDSGLAVGTKTITVDAAGTATVTKVDLAGKSLGSDLISTTGAVQITRHYSGGNALLAIDKATYASDGSVTTEHYNAASVFLGSDKVSTSGNAVVTEHYDAKFAFLGSEKVTTTNNVVTTESYDSKFKLTGIEKVTTANGSVTTEHYNSAWKLTGTDKVVTNTDGTVQVQHYDAAFKLTSVDVVKQVGLNTTTWHYDGAWKLQGSDVATLGADGVTKTLSYDAAGKLVSTSLAGTDRAETLTGSNGTTYFHGGLGGDTLVGGSGADYFHLDAMPAQGDVVTIRSFQTAADKIVLDHTAFGALGSVGGLSASAFEVGTKATSDTTRLIYDQAKGDLYYDDDGNGAHAPILLAHIGADAVLKASNFLVS